MWSYPHECACRDCLPCCPSRKEWCLSHSSQLGTIDTKDHETARHSAHSPRTWKGRAWENEMKQAVQMLQWEGTVTCRRWAHRRYVQRGRRPAQNQVCPGPCSARQRSCHRVMNLATWSTVPPFQHWGRLPSRQWGQWLSTTLLDLNTSKTLPQKPQKSSRLGGVDVTEAYPGGLSKEGGCKGVITIVY